jgi:peptidyl-tRNA hydrolase, PTH1 family
VRLLIGLGNPVPNYARTRHNIGFAALDTIAGKHGIDIGGKRFSALMGRGRLAGVDVLLVKPWTYMNLSGDAVGQVARYFRIEPGDLLVLHDDMDVEVGRLKVAAGGGPGGHKGVDSIIRVLGERDFARIKIGVGRPFPGRKADDYVLGRFADEEIETMAQMLATVAEAAETWVASGVAEAQARFNRRDLFG